METTPPPPTGPQEVRPTLLDLLGWVIVRPVQAMRFATHEAPLGWAFAVLLGVAVLTGLAGAFEFVLVGPPEDSGEIFPQVDVLDGADLGAFTLAFNLASPLFALIWATLWTGVLHLVARLLRGREGSYGGLFRGMCFASLPGVVDVPLTMLRVVSPAVGGPLSVLGGLGIAVWFIALSVIAIRENYRFTTARSLATIGIPCGCALALVLLLVIVIVVIVLVVALG